MKVRFYKRIGAVYTHIPLLKSQKYAYTYIYINIQVTRKKVGEERKVNTAVFHTIKLLSVRPKHCGF